MKAGVLALQGDFREHARVFGELGASPVEVRTPDDLARVDVLAIPGGESTTISKLARSAGLVEPIVEATTHFQDPDALAKVSRGLGEPMPGLDIKELGEEGLLQTRGW